MEEEKPAKRKKPNWLDFRALFAKWLVFRTQRPLAIKLTILGVLGGTLFVILIVGGIGGYFMYNYTQHNPKFCKTCHTIMIESYETWETSEHAEVTCHTCHALTPEVIMNYTYRILMGMPDKVPPREEGEIIVPSSDCIECHWEQEKEFPDANKVDTSRFHAAHYFMGKVECMTCHGDEKLHVFLTEEGDCLTCHENRQPQIHAAKNVELACLNCHTDQTAELNPSREKCFFCHSEDNSFRQQVIAAGGIDIKYAQPSEAMIANASKISIPADASMQGLNCAECHASHPEKEITASETCFSCHVKIENTEHARHLPYFQSNCLTCHQPHEWSIVEEWAQKECAKCHQYQAPVTFIQAKKK